MVEGLGLLEGPPEAGPVLDVAAEAADARVEDVLEGVLAEEEVAQHPHAPPHLSHPQSSQLSYRIDLALVEPQVPNKLLALQPTSFDKRPEPLLVLLHEGYDALPEVFRNIFGLVARLVHYLFLGGLVLGRRAQVVRREQFGSFVVVG